MENERNLSENGLSLITKFEGIATTAYICPAGVVTIGIGETDTFSLTGEKITLGMTITENQAKESFRIAVKKYEAAVNESVEISLNQNQFDALVSLTYNIGINGFKNSTLLKLLNQNKIEEASEQFERWVYANGKILVGLVNRRKEEKALFLKQINNDEVLQRDT